MASPAPIADSNQYDVLSSPRDEGKTDEGLRSRFGKDDIKEQAFQAREMIKSKVLDLKEQVVSSGIVNTVSSQLQPAIDLVKEKAGISKDVPNEQAVEDLKDDAAGEWEEVKRKGNRQMKKAKEVVNQKLDENLTKDQKAKLNKGLRQAKRGANQLEGEARGWSNQLINSTLSAPRLRPVKNFIVRNNLQLPAVILGAILTLWMGLTLIRLITSVATPSKPEFDIHSKENTAAWLRYHAGDYKDRAIDMKDSLATRAAAFLANYEWDALKGRAVDYRDIGMNKLGLTEPTWTEWAWAKLMGRPITWQDRVTNVLSLAKSGLNRADLHKEGIFDRMKHMLNPEPTLTEKASGMASGVYDSIKANIPGMRTPVVEPTGVVDGIKMKLQDGINTVTSGANYIKNRVVHSAQEAAHIAQDRANEASDKAKFKAGL